MLGSAQVELNAGKTPAVAVQGANLRNTGVATLAANVSCTLEGVEVINCTSYRVCVNLPGRGFVGAIYVCPAGQNLNFDTYDCSSSYDCRCTEPGFFCPTITSLTLCAAAGVPHAINTPCPPGYYCNEKCLSPCLNHIPHC
jgi:hypothetical protein